MFYIAAIQTRHGLAMIHTILVSRMNIDLTLVCQNWIIDSSVHRNSKRAIKSAFPTDDLHRPRFSKSPSFVQEKGTGSTVSRRAPPVSNPQQDVAITNGFQNRSSALRLLICCHSCGLKMHSYFKVP
ncbi:uncharacterized protein MYCFIDRAFT_211183 [Pseudocercospora fijiensis CIRAD86]|uniref:Uncharacterized protein n=1 Tax=Pseudocercospora fijiensis (strain CIRAD86) TaxID=383855 RepID=M2ZV42_PSEFD|nr:uncharacterized protein MYCFIDRAFT_211183 [Pseudocercospora fijiensis CIRAD86]EME82874.1 hypothetical protein MYCFIDRAFT_211183 [Pseudocercospora fijiensis CIRAD86]